MRKKKASDIKEPWPRTGWEMKWNERNAEAVWESQLYCWHWEASLSCVISCSVSWEGVAWDLCLPQSNEQNPSFVFITFQLQPVMTLWWVDAAAMPCSETTFSFLVKASKFSLGKNSFPILVWSEWGRTNSLAPEMGKEWRPSQVTEFHRHCYTTGCSHDFTLLHKTGQT